MNRIKWQAVVSVVACGVVWSSQALAEGPACPPTPGASCTNACKACPKCGQPKCACKKQKSNAKATAACPKAPAASEKAPAEDVDVPAGPGGDANAPEAPVADTDAPAPDAEAPMAK